MMVWEQRYTSVNDYAMVVSLDDHDSLTGRFRIDGRPKNWTDRPLVGFADSTRRKNKRPPADVSAMVPGVLVLSERAKDAMGPFLSQFGQLLELDCEGTGEIRYFYNVTNVVSCVDVERSQKTQLGDVKMESFDDALVPKEAAIFKDPSTHRYSTGHQNKWLILSLSKGKPPTAGTWPASIHTWCAGTREPTTW